MQLFALRTSLFAVGLLAANYSNMLVHVYIVLQKNGSKQKMYQTQQAKKYLT